MNRRLLNVLLVAFVISAGSSYLVYRLVRNRLPSGAPPITKVIAAATDIQVGSVLRAVDLRTVSLAGPLPKGAILKESDVVGRGVLSNLYAGEPIMESRLAAVGSGGGLAATIPQGMRASAVKVNDVVGVGGFATPGMRVDVLITGNTPGGSAAAGDGTKVRTLLQNIQVLSAGSDIQRDQEGKPHPVQVVNLLVTPEQAELLSLASNETKIQLILRNPLDQRVERPSGAAMAQLFGGTLQPDKPSTPITRPAVHRTATPAIYFVEVFNGSKRSESKFENREEKQ
jgi:pilus assembly protein CpaB